MSASSTPPVLTLVRGAYAAGFSALRAAWLPALAFIASGAWFAVQGPGGSLAAPSAILLFASGLYFSDAHYNAMRGAPQLAINASLLPLLLANLLLYLAFSFIGTFAIFFVLILAGILLQEASGDSLKEASVDQVQALFTQMLATPYGMVLLLVAAALAATVAYFALRLLTSGAATVAQNKIQVFSTWRHTRGAAFTLAAASVITHIVPFAFAATVWSLTADLSASPLQIASRGALTAAALIPFFAAGQGLAHRFLKSVEE